VALPFYAPLLILPLMSASPIKRRGYFARGCCLLLFLLFAAFAVTAASLLRRARTRDPPSSPLLFLESADGAASTATFHFNCSGYFEPEHKCTPFATPLSDGWRYRLFVREGSVSPAQKRFSPLLTLCAQLFPPSPPPASILGVSGFAFESRGHRGAPHPRGRHCPHACAVPPFSARALGAVARASRSAQLL
jgi:hypothetical protein